MGEMLGSVGDTPTGAEAQLSHILALALGK